MAANAETLTAGWYGKIPALGDFASRRLPPDFISAWDTWLQDGMAQSRAKLGVRWLETYLTCPVWHFILFPDVIGPPAWTGLMMPSIDKIGRHFPLTMALPLDPEQGATSGLMALHDWHADLEEVALATLNVDYLLETLEAALGTRTRTDRQIDSYKDLARAFADWWRGGAPETTLMLDGYQSPNDLLTAAGHTLLDGGGNGRSLWWNGTLSAGPQILRGFLGLPPASRFAGLLEGK